MSKQQQRYFVAGRIGTSQHVERIGQWAIADRADREQIKAYRESRADAERACKTWNTSKKAKKAA